MAADPGSFVGRWGKVGLSPLGPFPSDRSQKAPAHSSRGNALSCFAEKSGLSDTILGPDL